MTSRAASSVGASTTGGAVKCMTGSATPENITPIPMPADKSMANHDA